MVFMAHRKDPTARRREQLQDAAHRASREAHGLHVRGDQLAVLRNYLQQIDRAAPVSGPVVDQSTERSRLALVLADFVESVPDSAGIPTSIETRSVNADDPDPWAPARCCDVESIDHGGGFRECSRCGREFLLVPDR